MTFASPWTDFRHASLEFDPKIWDGGHLTCFEIQTQLTLWVLFFKETGCISVTYFVFL